MLKLSPTQWKLVTETGSLFLVDAQNAAIRSLIVSACCVAVVPSIYDGCCRMINTVRALLIQIAGEARARSFGPKWLWSAILSEQDVRVPEFGRAVMSHFVGKAKGMSIVAWFVFKLVMKSYARHFARLGAMAVVCHAIDFSFAKAGHATATQGFVNEKFAAGICKCSLLTAAPSLYGILQMHQLSAIWWNPFVPNFVRVVYSTFAARYGYAGLPQGMLDMAEAAYSATSTIDLVWWQVALIIQRLFFLLTDWSFKPAALTWEGIGLIGSQLATSVNLGDVTPYTVSVLFQFVGGSISVVLGMANMLGTRRVV